jgi:hypothetical protein
VTPATLERFLTKFEVCEDGCWQWSASLNTGGYGHIYCDEQKGVRVAHRLAYAHFVGPIPDGLELHHVCRNRRCVNPVHLRAVTRTEHVRLEGNNPNAAKTHCKRGHEFTPENTRLKRNDRGGRVWTERVCRACSREARRRDLDKRGVAARWPGRVHPSRGATA